MNRSVDLMQKIGELDTLASVHHNEVYWFTLTAGSTTGFLCQGYLIC